MNYLKVNCEEHAVGSFAARSKLNCELLSRVNQGKSRRILFVVQKSLLDYPGIRIRVPGYPDMVSNKWFQMDGDSARSIVV